MNAPHGDGHEPPAERPRILQRAKDLPRVEEGLLHDVVDVSVVAKHPEDDARDVPGVALVESAERFGIVARAFDEGGVGQQGKGEIGHVQRGGATSGPRRLKNLLRADCPGQGAPRDAMPLRVERLAGLLSSRPWRLDLALFAVLTVFLLFGLGGAGLWPALELATFERAGGAPRAHALVLEVIGPSVAGARTVSALATLAAAFLGARLFVALGQGHASRIAAVLLVVVPALATRARLATPDALTSLLVIATLGGFAVAVLDRERSRLGRSFALAFGGAAAFVAHSLVGPVFALVVPASAALFAWVGEPASTRRSPPMRASALALAAVATAGIALAVRSRGPMAAPALIAFDVPLTRLGHEAFPFSALAPLVLVAVPSTSAGRLAVAFAAALFAAESCGGSPASHHLLALGFALLLAVTLGAAPAARPSRLVLLAVAAAAALLALDFARMPEKLVAAFGPGARLPSVATEASRTSYQAAALLLFGGALIAAFVSSPRARRTLIFAAALVGALLVRFGALERVAKAASPQSALTAYVAAARHGEPLALLGVAPTVAKATGAHVAASFADVDQASDWLSAGGGRRFMAIDRSHLPRLNHRERARTGQNAFVLDARGGEAVLLSDRLLPSERSENPLDRVVMGAPPTELAAAHARFGDALEVVAFGITDAKGGAAGLATSAERHVRVALRVHAPVSGHCTFVHIDHNPTRFSAEHREAEWAAYPMALWRQGDVVIDDFIVRLPPAFSGAAVPILYGVGVLPCNDDRRMPLTGGAGDGNRALLARVKAS